MTNVLSRNVLKDLGSKMHFSIRWVILIFIYVVIDRCIDKLARSFTITESTDFIFIDLVQNLISGYWFILLILLAGLLLLLRKRLFLKWDEIDPGSNVKIMVCSAAVVLSWAHTTYDYNLYYDHSFMLDRLLLIGALILLYYRPVFIFLWVSVVLPVNYQFQFISSYSVAIISLPIHLIFMAGSYYLFYLIFKYRKPEDYLLLTISLVGAHYWLSGFGKLNEEWLLYDRIGYMLPATYANGWWSHLKVSTISSVTSYLLSFNFLFKGLTLVLEIGCMMMLWHRRVLILFVGGFALFHFGIFLVSGIFFWMWIVVDVTLLVVIFRKDNLELIRHASLLQKISTVAIIVLGTYWCRPTKLAWHDVPASYTYRFYATTEQGNRIQLSPDFFAPYEYDFVLGRFNYVTTKPTLAIVWGSTSVRDMPRNLENLATHENIMKYENENGHIAYDPAKKQQLIDFLKKYISHWNDRLQKRSGIMIPSAPLSLQTMNKSKLKDKIQTIEMEQVLSFFHKNEYREIRNIPILKVEMSSL